MISESICIVRLPLLREMFVGEVKNAAACNIIQTLARLSSNQFFDDQMGLKTVYIVQLIVCKGML